MFAFGFPFLAIGIKWAKWFAFLVAHLVPFSRLMQMGPPPQVVARLSALAGASIRDCYGADRLSQRGKQVDCTTGPLSAPHSPEAKNRLFFLAAASFSAASSFHHRQPTAPRERCFVPLPFVTAASPASAYLLHHCRLRAGQVARRRTSLCGMQGSH